MPERRAQGGDYSLRSPGPHELPESERGWCSTVSEIVSTVGSMLSAKQLLWFVYGAILLCWLRVIIEWNMNEISCAGAL